MPCVFCGDPYSPESTYNCSCCREKWLQDIKDERNIPPPLTRDEFSMRVWSDIQSMKYYGIRNGESPESIRQRILKYASDTHASILKQRIQREQVRAKEASLRAIMDTDHNFDFTPPPPPTSQPPSPPLSQPAPKPPQPTKPRTSWLSKVRKFFG